MPFEHDEIDASVSGGESGTRGRRRAYLEAVQAVLQYLRAVRRHWASLVIGVGGGVLGIAGELFDPDDTARVLPGGAVAIEERSLVPVWLWLTLFVGGLFVAQFRTWVDIRTERDNALAELTASASVALSCSLTKSRVSHPSWASLRVTNNGPRDDFDLAVSRGGARDYRVRWGHDRKAGPTTVTIARDGFEEFSFDQLYEVFAVRFDEDEWDLDVRVLSSGPPHREHLYARRGPLDTWEYRTEHSEWPSKDAQWRATAADVLAILQRSVPRVALPDIYSTHHLSEVLTLVINELRAALQTSGIAGDDFFGRAGQVDAQFVAQVGERHEQFGHERVSRLRSVVEQWIAEITAELGTD